MGKGLRLLSRPELDNEIFDSIRAGLTDVPSIAKHLGYARSTIGIRLKQLEEAYHVHRKTFSQGRSDKWFLGPEIGKDGLPVHQPKPLYATKAAALAAAAQESPANTVDFSFIGGRNMLDHFFFGPAKPHTARCTACGCEQGKGHLSGCIVALVAA